MKLKDLEEAAFWDNTVCTACEAVFDPNDLDEGVDKHRCPECGSAHIVAAPVALLVLKMVEEQDE